MKSMCLILLGALHKGKQELTRNNVKSGSLTHMKTLFAIYAMFKYQKDLFLLSLSFKCSILNVSKLLKIRTGFSKLSVKAFFLLFPRCFLISGFIVAHVSCLSVQQPTFPRPLFSVHILSLSSYFPTAPQCFIFFFETL